MWREGLGLALIAWILNAAALTFGAGLSAAALINPNWVARLVRLKADGEGGFAEFRATYGGVLLGLHGAALVLSLHWILFGYTTIGLYAAGAAGVLAAGWAGAAGGRLLSMVLDRTRTRLNVTSAIVEAVMALLIASPWLAWRFHGMG